MIVGVRWQYIIWVIAFVITYDCVLTSHRLLQEPCGLRGFWRGNLANVLRVVPTYGARFWLFALCDETLAFVPQTDTRRGVPSN